MSNPPDHDADAFDPTDVAIYARNLIAGGIASEIIHAVVRRLGERRSDGDPERDDPPYRTYVIYGPDGEEILEDGKVPSTRGSA